MNDICILSKINNFNIIVMRKITLVAHSIIVERKLKVEKKNSK